MEHIVFDTNVLILLVRWPLAIQVLTSKYPQSQFLHTISIVTEGELASFALQNKWGEQKTQKLNNLLNHFLILPIKAKSVIDAYGQIDAYSQNKLIDKPLAVTARNMGKNDLWIAATAFVTNATLVTTDQDFTHLENTFLKLDMLDMTDFIE